MGTFNNITNKSDEALQLKEEVKGITMNNETSAAFAELERAVHAALETYSNIHRGSGHNSMVSTKLYEQARGIILDYLGLNKHKYTVIFCTPLRAATLKAQLEPKSYQDVSSYEIGLSLGVVALAVDKKALPKGVPFHSGGGTTKLVSRDWVLWADAPDRFEAGTPAIINVIAFARAIQLIQKSGKDIFLNPASEKLSATGILYHDELEKYSGRQLLAELRQTLIGSGVQVPTMEGIKTFVNLDNSASTRTFTPVWDAFRRTLRQSEKVKEEIIHEVKAICAEALGASLTSYDIIFASNTTEAINLTDESLGRESEEGIEPVVINTLLEHSSNDLPWRMIPGYSLIRLPIDTEGFFNLSELETHLNEYNKKNQFGKKRIKLVAISGASNVLGICNNIAEISRIVHSYGARLLVDAAQLAAHCKIDIEDCGIDYLAFSAHKVYAPFGCGVLVYRKGLLNFNTAELELIKSSGEENAGGIAALGKALVLLQRIGMDVVREEEKVLTERALKGLAQINGITIYGVKNPESSGFTHKIGVIVFSLKGMMPDRVAKELALRSGIGVRYGCHCAHLIIKHLLNVSPFLERFQRLMLTLFPKIKLPGLVRMSLGLENDEADVDRLIQVLGIFAKKPLTSKDSNATPDEASLLPRAEVKRKINDFAEAAALRVYSQLK